MQKMTVVNILGEPGCGKSTTTAGLFFELSTNGYKTEIVQEAAKDFVWEASRTDTGEIIPPYILGDQLFLFAEQNRRIERLRKQREIIIVECPLLMSLIYQPQNYYKEFNRLVLEVHHSYNNINILLERNHSYDEQGRVQTESETQEMRSLIINMLKQNNIDYKVFKTHKHVNKEIASYIEEMRNT